LRAALVLLAFGLLVGTVLAWWLDRGIGGGLPPLDGDFRLPGLTAEVRIERDDLGVPTIHGQNRLDVAFGTGFVHGQDRFFQMDLLRRHAAGELAELFGPGLLGGDRTLRVHRFRALARRKLQMLSGQDRALLESYVRGVEAGRRSLPRRPFEYFLLGVEPRPWSEEDSLLVALGMFPILHGGAIEHERVAGLLYDLLPGPLADFLSPPGSCWDAPLQGPALACPPIPGPDVLDLRKRPPAWDLAPGRSSARRPQAERLRPGSNCWAVAGRLTTHGGAILANDMHLMLSAPAMWDRAALTWPGEGGQENRVIGVTLPGTPAVVVGSNTHVAWGFTNTEGDWTDLVLLEPGSEDPNLYQTPAGPRQIEQHLEVLKVKGAADVPLSVEWTIWGPVLDKDHRGRRRALRWTAHDPEAINFALMGLESARSVADAIAIAPRAGVPPQNFIVADAAGHIAWTVAGRMPRRVGLDGRRPTSWADGTCRWDGWLDPKEYPRIVDPPSGRLWTANNRVLAAPELGKIGLGTYDLGARARQIRDGLSVAHKLSEADMLAIQLDDRALFLQRWRQLLLEVLERADDPPRRALRRAVDYWGSRAAIDSVGFRVVRLFRRGVHQRVLAALTEPCRRADRRFSIGWLDANVEDSVWELLTHRPAHLLPPRYLSWDELLLDAVEAVRRRVGGRGDSFARRLGRFTWGRYNTIRIHHPLADGSALLDRWLGLAMPAEPLPGDSGNMPRVQGPGFGASQRLAVSPGREEAGYFHMPGGQSGHPWSPHYRDAHAAWARGLPTPFLPGPAWHELVLRPE
jgi:penicillin amidase